MILTVGNIKGGVGKTTIAVNIAIARQREGEKVLLIDGDEQRTAMMFSDLRGERLGDCGYAAVALTGKAILHQVPKLARDYGEVVIDVGGRDTGSLRAALTVSDVILIPVQPRSFDVWAIEEIAERVREARFINPALKAFVMLNSCDVQGRDNQDSADILKDVEGLDFLSPSIARRKAFANAASNGLSVFEQAQGAGKAREEMDNVVNFLYRRFAC